MKDVEGRSAPHLLAQDSGTLRWVERNEDKPHRCPDCHCVAEWHRPGYDHHRDRRHGPRTRMWCVYCRVVAPAVSSQEEKKEGETDD